MNSIAHILVGILFLGAQSCGGPEVTSSTDAASDGVADAEVGGSDAALDTELPEAFSCLTDVTCSFGLICEQNACVELPCTSRDQCLAGSRACVVVESKSVCALVECGCDECAVCDIGQVCNNGKCGVPRSD